MAKHEAMTRIGIVWGSTTGNSGDAAERLQVLLGVVACDVRDVCDTPLDAMLEYDVLIVGCSTWEIGQLQHDWSRRFEDLRGNFTGKCLAFFGCGDAFGYPASFQDGIGILWERFSALGATLIGKWPIEGYEFTSSRALLDDGEHFVGLALDNESEAELTESRLQNWAAQLQSEIASLARSGTWLPASPP